LSRNNEADNKMHRDYIYLCITKNSVITKLYIICVLIVLLLIIK